MPKGQYDRATSKWKPTPLKDDPPELVADVRALYESGLTMRETAEIVGVSVKVLQRLMPRYGISRRRAARRHQHGSCNPNWRGDDAKYAALHKRVRMDRGNPTTCANCGTSSEWIDWANMTGEYTNVGDYMALCRPCHRAYDAGRRA